MFEGLLDDDLSAYVTTAANAFESSWATYCPEFFSSSAQSSSSSSRLRRIEPARSWLMQALYDGLSYLQHLLSPGAAPSGTGGSSSSRGGHGPPSPQLTTCLGDLYSGALQLLWL